MKIKEIELTIQAYNDSGELVTTTLHSRDKMVDLCQLNMGVVTDVNIRMTTEYPIWEKVGIQIK